MKNIRGNASVNINKREANPKGFIPSSCNITLHATSVNGGVTSSPRRSTCIHDNLIGPPMSSGLSRACETQFVCFSPAFRTSSILCTRHEALLRVVGNIGTEKGIYLPHCTISTSHFYPRPGWVPCSFQRLQYNGH